MEMETFLIGFLSVAIPMFMYYTLGGRNTLYIFGAICIFGILVAVFEDKDFSSSEKDFVCVARDGDIIYPKVATLIVDEANKTIKFKDFVENKTYADLKYLADQTNKPEIFAYSQSKAKSILFDRNTQEMQMRWNIDTDNPSDGYWQCRQSSYTR